MPYMVTCKMEPTGTQAGVPGALMEQEWHTAEGLAGTQTIACHLAQPAESPSVSKMIDITCMWYLAAVRVTAKMMGVVDNAAPKAFMLPNVGKGRKTLLA